MINTLQPLLAKDKQNPSLSIYKSENEPDKLEVYFEMAFLEKIENGIDSYHGKHLLARLYNAKFKRKSLVEIFKNQSQHFGVGEMLYCQEMN